MEGAGAMKRIVVDLDDYSDDNAVRTLGLLDRLHEHEPGFRATVFAIPGRCGPDALAQVGERPWLQLAAHGWDHRPAECVSWDHERATDYLRRIDALDAYARVFKAPFWQTSPGLYAALMAEGWALADHPSNLGVIPVRLRSYVLGPRHGIGDAHPMLGVVQAHGHVDNVCGNGLAECFEAFDALRLRRLPYAYVSEVVT